MHSCCQMSTNLADVDRLSPFSDRGSFSHRLSGQSLQESPVASSFANDSSISGHVSEPGRSTPDLSSPPPGGVARSGLDGLDDSAVDWHLLSPALHAQRQANIAGRKHGGSFSRKIVEEIVEKMEKKSAVEQAKGDPIRLHICVCMCALQ